MRTIEKLLDDVEKRGIIITGAKISESGRLKVFLFNPKVGAHYEDEIEGTEGIVLPKPKELSESEWNLINVIGCLSDLEEKKPELTERIENLKKKIIEREAPYLREKLKEVL